MLQHDIFDTCTSGLATANGVGILTEGPRSIGSTFFREMNDTPFFKKYIWIMVNMTRMYKK